MCSSDLFNGVEEKTVKKLIQYLKENKEEKIIIISTHIKEDLKSLSDTIYYFDDGKISEEKTNDK